MYQTDLPADEFSITDRDDAVRICAALSNHRESFAYDDADAVIEAGVSLGASARAVDLALAASRAVPALDDEEEPLSAEATWRMAASWLRAGWARGVDEATLTLAEEPEPEAAPIGFDDTPFDVDEKHGFRFDHFRWADDGGRL